MTFFNGKEDVIKMELTPYGRRLLAKGKFVPTYYTFLDDNILYNSSFGGFNELSSQAHQRIQNETAYLKPQTNYKGVATSIDTHASQLSDNFNDDNLIPERVEKLQMPLGKSNPASQLSSQISVNFLYGELSSSTTQFTGSGAAPVNIPQIECKIENILSVEYKDELDVLEYGIQNLKKIDGSFVKMHEEEIMIFLQDLEGFDEKDNYSIEVFEYIENETKLMPLKMKQQKQMIVNDILLDDVGEDVLQENNIYSNDYFTILFDNEINEAKLCTGISKLKNQNLYIPIAANCENVETEGFEVDLYRSITTNNDLEDC